MTDHDRELLYETHKQIIEINAMVREMRLRLLGNGQPGEIEKLHLRIGTVRDSHDGRITKLEHSRTYIKGVLWAIGLLTTGAGLAILKHLVSLS